MEHIQRTSVFVILIFLFCINLLCADNLHSSSRNSQYRRTRTAINNGGSRVKKNSYGSGTVSAASGFNEGGGNGAGVDGAPLSAMLSMIGNRERERKPNIVLILTDDQDVELGESTYLFILNKKICIQSRNHSLHLPSIEIRNSEEGKTERIRMLTKYVLAVFVNF